MIKKSAYILAIFASSAVMAQDIPQLPGQIAPGVKDTSYFICDVANVNEEIMQMSAKGNFWTKAAIGGKFQATSTITVRVAAESTSAAAQNLFDFYRRYAAAVFIRAPWYDRGTRLNMTSLVKKCSVDSSRVTVTNLKVVPLAQYRYLATDQEHSLNFIKLTKTTLSDDQIAKLTREKPLSADGFERREQIQKSAASARAASATAAGPYVVLEGTIYLNQFSFEKNSFDLSRLQESAQKYAYVSNIGSLASPPPVYELRVPAKMMAYHPTSIEDAKKIERTRSQQPYLKLRSYVQVSEAIINQNGTPIFNGTIAAIEVLDSKNNIMFSLLAQ